MAALRRGAVRPLLRQRRFDAAVRPARRPLCRAHRRRGNADGAVARHRGRARAGSTDSAIPMATASSNTAAQTDQGLANQGWKDSHDAIFHADGRSAEGAIALAEVQGYVYAAKQAAARCARRLEPARSRRGKLEAEAQRLARAFRGGVLVPGDRDLRARARRRQAAMPGAHLQCRAGAVHRHRAAGARRAGRRELLRAAVLLRLGHPHRGARRSALQSDVVSQRLDLAARQRADRARLRALRLEARGRRRSSRACSSRRPTWICGGCRNCSAASSASGGAGRRSIRSPARRRPGRARRRSR